MWGERVNVGCHIPVVPCPPIVIASYWSGAAAGGGEVVVVDVLYIEWGG